MKKQNKYTSIKHSLSNDIMSVNCSIKTIERVLNDNKIDAKNIFVNNVDNKDYFLIDSINNVKKSMLNIFHKLDEYTRENKLTQ